MEKLRMQDFPIEERPYEKCMRFGPESLTDTEILSMILRSGSRNKNVMELSRELLDNGSNSCSLGNLHNWTYEKLLDKDGIGRVKAMQILCLAELAKRLSKERARGHFRISSPSSIAEYYMEDMCHERQEIVRLIMLDSKTRFIRDTVISKGTVNASLITPREIFAEALLANAVSVILMHNHPSGDPTPSDEDIYFTDRVLQAGNLINIHLLDHIIIGDNCYMSFVEKGLLHVQ